MNKLKPVQLNVYIQQLTFNIQECRCLEFLGITCICPCIIQCAAMNDKFSDSAISNDVIFLGLVDFLAILKPFNLSIFPGQLTLKNCSGFLFYGLVLQRFSKFNWRFYKVEHWLIGALCLYALEQTD